MIGIAPCDCVPFCKESVFMESTLATAGPTFGFCISAIPETGVCGSSLNAICTAFPNVRMMAITAAALNNGISRCRIGMIFAFTGVFLSTSANIFSSKASFN